MKTNHNNIKVYTGTSVFRILPVWVLLLFAITLNSCKKFVQTPPPQTELVTASVFNNNASATEAQTNIYTSMWNNNGGESYTMELQMGLYSDELAIPTSDASLIPYYTNSLFANATSTYFGPWNTAYTYIYDANAVISGLATTQGCSAAVKQQLSGEGYFTRAFWHFYLTNIYGDIPLVLTTDYNANAKISRTLRVQVLQQVVADLKNAQNLLNSNYVDASDTATTTERVRPNKAAATALLARAYLYLGDYAKDPAQYANAEAQASSVIGNNAYSLSPLAGVFLANSSEAIWQLQTPLNGGIANYDTPDGYGFVLIAAPGTGTSNTATISPQLLGSFEPNDQRLTNWIGSYATPTVTYYFPYKYKNYTYVGTEYVMMLRLGEQYLIRAEAEAQEGKTSNAIADLNIIRQRAGLNPYAGATDKTSLITAILHERQVELFAEWGHRWFDLERTGNAPSVLGSPGNVCQAKGGVWNTDNYQLLFPIPGHDRSADPNLTQNPGY